MFIGFRNPAFTVWNREGTKGNISTHESKIHWQWHGQKGKIPRDK